MKDRSALRIAIIGGGPSGLILARILQNQGISFVVYEAEPAATARWGGSTLDLRPGTGRRAIKEAGLESEFVKYARFIGQELYILDHRANILLSHKADDSQSQDEASPEIGRGDLRKLLLQSIEPTSIVWGHKLVGATQKQNEHSGIEYELQFGNGSKVVADLVVGADGTFSKTRTFLVDPSKPRYSGVTLIQMYISPSTDPNVKETERLPGIEDFLGQGLALISDSGKSLIFQREGDQVIRVYASQFLSEDSKISSDVKEVKRHLLQDLNNWDDKLLNFIRECDETKATPWRIYAADVNEKRESKDGVVLIGDANKPMSPYAGEGANTAMADGCDLGLILSKHLSAVSPTSNQAEKSQALLNAQQEFHEIQFPRAQDAAVRSLKGFQATFEMTAQERANHLKRAIGVEEE